MKYKLTFEITDTDSWANRNMATYNLRHDRAVQVGTELAKELNESKDESHLEFVFAGAESEDTE